MKKICGIVAEYNPFHAGHAHHIAAAREILGPDAAVVCVMSGNFVQRGGPAVFEKHVRAAAALRGGADLALELPLPWAMASAEGFAKGAVSALAATGLVTDLCFGSEGGDIRELSDTAALLLSPELTAPLKRRLAEGMSYPRARQAAAEALRGGPVPALGRPNDLLGIEYLKALAILAPELRPHAIPRTGAAHDGQEDGAFLSASRIRDLLEHGEVLPETAVPEAAAEIYRMETEAGGGPVFAGALELAALSRLRGLPEEAWNALPDAAEGLENRLRRAAAEAASLEGILETAAAKRYPAARLRRMLWAAVLGLRAEDAAGVPPYLRVLGADARGRELLAEMRNTAAVPVLTKPADARGFADERARRVFELEAAATDLWRLGCPNVKERAGGAEWRTGPVMI